MIEKWRRILLVDLTMVEGIRMRRVRGQGEVKRGAEGVKREMLKEEDLRETINVTIDREIEIG